ncbi:MAG: hypothetical protein A2Z34_07015 [Planctomycetes bacterium RBG_16_59_8]|nr:MAG: hypothetical protein A2Z34_07015 [Planctomycetes bacterium RBG_16_59_8]
MGRFLILLTVAAAVLLPTACGGGGAPRSRTVSGEPEKARLLYDEAKKSVEESDLHRAVDCLTKAIACAPEYAEAYDYRARLERKVGRHAQAESDFSTAIRIKPKEASFYNNRSELYKSLRRFSEAERDICHAIALDDTIPEFYLNRALLFMDMEKYAEAKKDFSRLLLFSPTESTRRQIEIYIEEVNKRLEGR